MITKGLKHQKGVNLRICHVYKMQREIKSTYATQSKQSHPLYKKSFPKKVPTLGSKSNVSVSSKKVKTSL